MITVARRLCGFERATRDRRKVALRGDGADDGRGPAGQWIHPRGDRRDPRRHALRRSGSAGRDGQPH